MMGVIISSLQKFRSTLKETFHLWAAFVFYSVFFWAFFSPVFFGGKLFPSDGQLASFYSPIALWDNLLWSGFPMAADGTWQMWYPLRHIFRLLPKGWDFNCYILSVYVLSSTFTYGYVFTLTRSWLAGMGAGIVFGMSGFMMAHLGQTSVIHTAMWCPLIMWGMEKLRQRDSALWVCVGAVAVGNCILGSHFQIALYSMIFSFLYAAVLGKDAAHRWTRYMVSVCLVFLLGVGLSTILVIPAMEFSGLSDRAKMSFDAFTSHSLPVKQLSQIIFPYLLGGVYPTIYGGAYFGAFGKEELTGYVGFLPWIFALICLFSVEHRRLVIFFSAVILFAILASLGNATPLANILYYIPFVNKFRVPSRHFFEMTFAISVLTGIGIHLIQAKQIVRAQLIRASVLFSIIIMIVLICIYLWYPEYEKLAGKINLAIPKMVFNNAIVIPLFILLLSYMILFYWHGFTSSTLRQGLILIALAINMGSSAWFNEWRPAAPGRYLLEKPDYALNLKAPLEQTRQRFTPIDGYASALFPTNYSRLWEVPSASGYGPLMLKRYKDFSGIQEPGTLRNSSFLSRDNRSFDLLAIRYVLSTRLGETTENAGFSWNRNNLQIILGSGCNLTFPNRLRIELSSEFYATRLGIVSMMSCSTDVIQNAGVLRLIFTEENGRKSYQFLRAGIDTSEWAHECKHVKPNVRHEMATVFTTFAASINKPDDCEGHDYLASIPLAGGHYKEVELEWTGVPAFIQIQKISLLDERANKYFLVENNDALFTDRDRWRLVEHLGKTAIYENLQALPRAWLVSEVLSARSDEILKAIHTSVLPDGRKYRPERMALVEEPLSVKMESEDPPSSVSVVKLSNMNIQVRTSSQHPRFLVMSDIYYPGWVATIDGIPTRIFRANYVLRGLLIPRGEHMVSLQYHPRSFLWGAGISVLSFILIIIICIAAYCLGRQNHKIVKFNSF